MKPKNKKSLPEPPVDTRDLKNLVVMITSVETGSITSFELESPKIQLDGETLTLIGKIKTK
jgi:hypothetical protein